MNGSVSRALADALDHHRRGRLSEAEAGYRRVLETAPDNPDALHRLGIIAHQAGRHDVALEFIDRAIAITPSHPAYHDDAGIVLHALRRYDEAIARYEQALALDPNDAKARNGIGIVRNDQGRLDDAEESFRLALSIAPDHAAAQNNLANVLRARGRPAEAVRIYRRALELRADSPDLWYNLGNVQSDQHAFDEAASAYGRALWLRPDFVDARARLADALFALAQADSALAQYARVLAVRESPDAIAGFVGSFAAARLRHAGDDVRRLALRALSIPWARPAELAAACLRVLAGVPAIRHGIERAWAAWPSRLGFRELFGDDAGVVFADPLLRLLLESTPVCDLPMERFLTMARVALLDAPTDIDLGGDAALAFRCALARQCFVNGYVFFHADDEIAQAARLRERLAASLVRGDAVPAIDLAIVAAYFPLDALGHDDALLSREWPQPLAALLAQQLREPMEERAARECMRRLTAIGDDVTARVREQYEEHPYPRWIRLPPSAPSSFAETNRDARFPLALRESGERAGGLDILIAGCGTGQESIEFAQAFPRARVLAIDVSLASLAYAERKARELGIANVEHAQADILDLASLGRRFDVISSVGVLHHLADPTRGMRELASMLAPGGRMLIGLYSERGRRDVTAARAFIAEHGYRPTADDVRRCRQALMSAHREGEFAPLASRDDFYVTAECRDLLFHVEEHRFTLPQIRGCLDALDLSFESFLLPPASVTRFRERFADDAAIDDLDQWDAFEAEFPDAFASMYIFWVRKRASTDTKSEV